MKQTRGQKIFGVFNYIFLTALALLCLMPMINIIALSFSSRNMVNAGFVTFWPKEFTLSSYEYMLEKTRQYVPVVEKGIFGAEMQVSLINDGPFTIVLDEHLFG